jgi:ribosomal protein L17
MKESSVTRLSLEDVMELLEVETITGTPRQLERLRKWIEKLVEQGGKAEVWESRQDLLSRWEQHLKAKSRSCC